MPLHSSYSREHSSSHPIEASFIPIPTNRKTQPEPAARVEMGQPQWKTVACQRFFPSREGSQYFEVTTPPPEKPSQHIIPVWAQAEKALEQRKQAIEWSEQKIVTEGEATEVNPWLERAGWHTYLAGIERDKMLESVDRPDAEIEPMLTAIWQAIDDMTQHCQQTIIHRVGIFVRLEAIRSEKHQTRYHPLQGYMSAKLVQEYGRPWKQIVMFIGRTYQQREWKVPTYKLNKKQRTA